GEVATAEGRSVDDAAFHRVEGGVEHAAAGQQRARRHVTTRERLGQRDQIRLNAPVLEGQEPAGAPETGLNLVDDQQRAVAPAQLLGAGQIALGGDVDALALDRLDDAPGHVSAPELTLEVG